ncbi:MAG TPA: isoprenylcysteine carboxylmethyltransferase family protein [Terracidiphilus sp.]|jgi:protein-S-isoprenylcysteine O-methyltransferase Ste14
MRASSSEYRLRILILFAIVCLGFWSPWIERWGIGHRTSLLEWLALELSRLGLVSFAAATPTVIVFATIVAALGAFFSVWGTAYLDPHIVNAFDMNADAVMASGPYRYVRNPLYLGSFFMIAAIAFTMPTSGALISLPLIAFFLLRLILSEETFLTAKIGEPYQAYLRAVPRLFPRLRTTLTRGDHKPHWVHSVLTEANPIGVMLITAILWWRYDNSLMVKAFAICFAASLALRGLIIRTVVTVIALVCFGVLFERGRMPWYTAALISFGVWLILHAYFPTLRQIEERSGPPNNKKGEA